MSHSSFGIQPDQTQKPNIPSHNRSLQAFQDRPKLILVIVIDQFGANNLMKFGDTRKTKGIFLPAMGKNQEMGGFAYLMNHGAYFPYAEYSVSQNFTAPGHATILTGSYPYRAGITANAWYNRETDRLEEAVYDADSPLVGSPSSHEHSGRSPKNLVATTLGDELKNAGYPSRVISIALKDRAAILLGGHRADLALWYDSPTHSWISSQYYVPTGQLPSWVTQMNAEIRPNLNKTIEWRLLSPASGLSAVDAMPRLNAKNAGMIGGKDFPHFAKVGTEAVSSTPYGLELTRIAAEKALRGIQLGKGPGTDLLAISFSSYDVVGHAFGPQSREIEEMTRHIDREISKLLNTVKKYMPNGLNDVVIVLTGDHGAPPTPEWAKAHHIHAGRIDENALIEKMSAHLDKKFGTPKEAWFHTAYLLNFYLNHKNIREKKLSLADVQKEAKWIAQSEPNVSVVVTASEIAMNSYPPGIYHTQVMHGYFQNRSGDLLLIPRPYFMQTEGGSVTHLTGYTYDRTVPLLLLGQHFRPKVYSSRAEVVDIAPTLSFLAGVIPPSLSEGRVLGEALDF